MKNKIIAGLLMTLILSSCGEEFLKEQPYSFVSAEALYNSDAGVKSVVTGCYGAIADYNGFGASYISLLTIGSGAFWTTSSNVGDLRTLNPNSTTEWVNNHGIWSSFYGGIKVTNDIIDKVPKGSASQSTKNNALGQAYFIRGMLYFNLVRIWGGVPLRTKPTTVNDMYIKRNTREEVYSQIISDLEMAKSLLPITKLEQETGRPIKYAASALLGKVYIAMACNDENSPGWPAGQISPNWQKAKDELLDVYTSQAYQLVSKFSDVFSTTNENNSESIFEIQNSINTNGSLTLLFGPKNGNMTPLAINTPYARIRVNKEIFDAHVDQYTLNDPRINGSYYYNKYTKNTGSNQTVYPANTTNEGFPYIAKYNDPAFVSNLSNKNFIYLRYADVLLCLAECENEINGPDNAYQYVNLVLDRARKSVSPAATTPQNFSGMTRDEFRRRILLERRYELIGEGHIWYDVRRKGEKYYFDFINNHNNYPKLNLSYDYKYMVDAKSLLLPIPAVELNSNQALSASDNNPGY